MNKNFDKYILIIILLVCVFSSCNTFKATTLDKPESMADIKKRLWQQATKDQAHVLKTVVDYDIRKYAQIARPTSFLVSNDSIYINDNMNGKLFKTDLGFRSVNQIGGDILSYPMRIRELDDNLFVYDNKGINRFNKDGQFIQTVQPFLKIDDFVPISDGSYVASLADLKLDIDPNLLAVLNSTGKRTNSIAEIHFTEYPTIENKAFIEFQDEKVYVFYGFHPLIEIYDTKNKKLIQSININSSIFPELQELRKDKKYMNPEPGVLRIPKFIAGAKIFQDNIYVLLHTPNPEIIKYTMSGQEIERFIAPETPALDYFGLDIRLDNGLKHFFVGTVDYFGKPSITIYKE